LGKLKSVRDFICAHGGDEEEAKEKKARMNECWRETRVRGGISG
jgi:hypothetical protein